MSNHARNLKCEGAQQDLPICYLLDGLHDMRALTARVAAVAVAVGPVQQGLEQA